MHEPTPLQSDSKRWWIGLAIIYGVALLTVLSWNRWCDVVIDFGRELWVKDHHDLLKSYNGRAAPSDENDTGPRVEIWPAKK